METEERLLAEIKKWTKKIETEIENMETYGTKGNEFLKNIKAYVSDSGHFLENGDMVRSFEAIVWAWAWLEIGKELDYLRNEYVSVKKGRIQ